MANLKISQLPETTAGEDSDLNVVVQSGINKKIQTVNALKKTLNDRGTIALAADFPTLTAVRVGWLYRATALVTDNDAAKTNTGQVMINGDQFYWNGTNWTIFGEAEAALAQSNAETYADNNFTPIIPQNNIFYFNATGSNSKSGRYIEDALLTPAQALSFASGATPSVAMNLAYTSYASDAASFYVSPATELYAPNCSFSITAPGSGAGKNSKLIACKILCAGSIPALSYDTSGAVGDSFLTLLDGLYKTGDAVAAAVMADSFGTLNVIATNLVGASSSDKIFIIGKNNTVNINVTGSLIGAITVDTGSVVNITCFNPAQLTYSGAGTVNIFGFNSENLWDRSGTDLIPKTAGDNVNVGTGALLGANLKLTAGFGVNTVYVDGTNGTDAATSGQWGKPYKTIQYAVDNNLSDTLIVLSDSTFTANVNLAASTNVVIMGSGSINNKGTVIVGNVSMGGTSSSNALINVSVIPVSGVPLTLNVCSGTNYFADCKFTTAGTTSIKFNDIGCTGNYLFTNCQGNGAIAPNASAPFTVPPVIVINGANSSFGDIVQTYASTLDIDGRVGQLTHTSGTMILRRPQIITSATSGIISTATAASSSLIVFGFANLTQANGTLKTISKTGDCPFTLGNPIYNPVGSAFTGTGTRGSQAGSVNVTYVPTNYTPTGSNANQHFTGVDNRFGSMFFVSTTRPTATSDTAHGYYKGSLIYIAGLTCPELYFCCDPTNNAAVWKVFTTNMDKNFFDGSVNRWTRIFVPSNVNYSSFSLNTFTDVAREVMKFLIVSSTLQIVENTIFAGLNASSPQIKIWKKNSDSNFYIYIYSKTSADTTVLIEDYIGLSVAWSAQGSGALPAEFGGSETDYTEVFDSSNTAVYPQKIIADDTKVVHLSGGETLTGVKTFTTGANPKYSSNPTLASLADAELINKKAVVDNFIQNNSSDIGANFLYSETHTTPLSPISLTINSLSSINTGASTAISRNPNDPVAPATVLTVTAKTNVAVTDITTRSSSQVWVDPVTDTVDFTEFYDVTDAARIFSKINVGALAHPAPSGSIVGLVNYNRNTKDGGLAQALHHLAALGNVSVGIKVMPKPGDNLNLYMTAPGYVIGCFISDVLTPATPSILTIPIIDSTVSNGMVTSYYNSGTGAFVQTITANIPTQYNDVTDPVTPLKAVPAGKWAITRVFVTNPLGGTPTFPAKFACMYGQKLYSSAEMAMANAWNREAISFLGSTFKTANAAFVIIFNNGLTTSINAALTNSPNPNAYTFGGLKTNPFSY